MGKAPDLMELASSGVGAIKSDSAASRLAAATGGAFIGRFATGAGVPEAVAEHLKAVKASTRSRSQSEMSLSADDTSHELQPSSSTRELLRSFRKELMAMKHGGSMFLQDNLDSSITYDTPAGTPLSSAPNTPRAQAVDKRYEDTTGFTGRYASDSGNRSSKTTAANIEQA